MKLEELLVKIADELKLRNYSRKTVKSYSICLTDYFKYIRCITKNPDIVLIKKILNLPEVVWLRFLMNNFNNMNKPPIKPFTIYILNQKIADMWQIIIYKA